MADDLKNGKIEALFANVTAIGGGHPKMTCLCEAQTLK